MKIHNVKQGTKEWLDLRKGKLTGTTASSVAGYREMLKAELVSVAQNKGVELDEKKLPGLPALKEMILDVDPDFSFRVMEVKFNKDFGYKMIAFQLTGKIDEEAVNGNPMVRGSELEPEARELFEKIKKIKVEEVGFVTLDVEKRIGLSPDGLIKNKVGIFVSGLEIKAPCAWKFIKYWVENVLPTEYKGQVLDYFVQSDTISKVWLMLYNPDVKIHPYHIFEVNREDVEVDIKMLKEAQITFWKEHDKRIKNIKKLAKTYE